MTGSSDTTTIYNATDGPLAIDRAGRMIAAGETREGIEDVTDSPLAGHLSAGRIFVVGQTDDDAPAEADTHGDAESDVPAEAVPQTTTSKRTRKGAASTQEA